MSYWQGRKKKKEKEKTFKVQNSLKLRKITSPQILLLFSILYLFFCFMSKQTKGEIESNRPKLVYKNITID